MIEDLVQAVWNETSESGQLDASSVSDFILNQSRNYGVNSSECYFGRAPSLKVQKVEDKDFLHDQKGYVHTSASLRLLEQVALSIEQNEAMLLVGETGTGKTSTVQHLASILNKKLHVFNMNQNTDSSDLLGGFKPVDLKFLLKPVYELFLQLFKSLFKASKNQPFLDLT
jgi:midasin (ATPase involved in ribosome maturation)